MMSGWNEVVRKLEMVRQIYLFADGHNRVQCTGSLLNSEVKWRRARLVLGWGTAWEDLRVLSAFVVFFGFTFQLRML